VVGICTIVALHDELVCIWLDPAVAHLVVLIVLGEHACTGTDENLNVTVLQAVVKRVRRTTFGVASCVVRCCAGAVRCRVLSDLCSTPRWTAGTRR